jgi:hypothetical protein
MDGTVDQVTDLTPERSNIETLSLRGSPIGEALTSLRRLASVSSRSILLSRAVKSTGLSLRMRVAKRPWAFVSESRLCLWVKGG